MPLHHTVAYFSMEVGLESALPTYSGGLGVLAGDTIRSAADLEIRMLAVTLLHRKGYLKQTLDARGWQSESPEEWSIRTYLTEIPQRASITLEGRTVYLRAWRYEVAGITGHRVPVFFLDADLPENNEYDRHLTDFLYGGDERYRLCQEAILGIGGVRMLRALGYSEIGRYHLNEGHAALLGLALLQEQAAEDDRSTINQDDVEAVRRQCVFTTHTPVPAGHDKFPMDLVERVIGIPEISVKWESVVCHEGRFNLTYMALSLSHYVNGVAKRHGEVSRALFPEYQIDAITNGVHAATWMCEPMRRVLDRHIPDWRKDNFGLRYALSVPDGEVWDAHQHAKNDLIETISGTTGVLLDPGVLTLGFARRATAYKRPDLLLDDPQRLAAIARQVGPIQVIYSGKAHPKDVAGKELITHIYQAREAIKDVVKVVYLPNYDINVARQLVAGVDVWLNTPQPPLEASGTSGMKAALNGVPSLSVRDGWWAEGHIEGVTGWAICEDGENVAVPESRQRDADSLYRKLREIVVPTFYHNHDRWCTIMLHCIGLNGSFFNTQRMMYQYVMNAYFR